MKRSIAGRKFGEDTRGRRSKMSRHCARLCPILLAVGLLAALMSAPRTRRNSSPAR